MADNQELGAEEKQLIRAYQDLFMGSAEGQLVLWDLLNQTYVFRKFNQQNAGAYAMEGKREIGLYIFEKTNLSPQLGGMSPEALVKIKHSLNAAEKVRQTDTKEG